MRAAYITDVKQTEIREIDKPVPKKGEVLIKIESVGICGSDLHLFLGVHAFRRPPVILGHEMSGTVCELGEGVTKFGIGDRVTVNPSVSCGRCYACRRGLENICEQRKAPGTDAWIGCFAEYFPTPEETVYKIHDDVEFSRAALTEPLSVATHILRRASVQEIKTMAVIGGGTIGLMTLYLAKKKGVEKIICSDPAAYNRNQALKFGADLAVDPLSEDPVKAAMQITDGEGVDLCIVAAGAPMILDQASQMTRKGGEIGLVAMITKPITFYCYSIVFREQRIFGSQIYQTCDFEDALGVVQTDERLSAFVTQRMPVEDVQKAMEMLAEKKENVIKIILEWKNRKGEGEV